MSTPRALGRGKPLVAGFVRGIEAGMGFNAIFGCMRLVSTYSIGSLPLGLQYPTLARACGQAGGCARPSGWGRDLKNLSASADEL